MDKYFTVTETKRSYKTRGDENTTHDLVWLNQKCFFAPGSTVTIEDENHNKKVYVKESEQ